MFELKLSPENVAEVAKIAVQPLPHWMSSSRLMDDGKVRLSNGKSNTSWLDPPGGVAHPVTPDPPSQVPVTTPKHVPPPVGHG